MSVGAMPGISGNLTTGPICVSCQGPDNEADPLNAQDYGGRIVAIGTPQGACGPPHRCRPGCRSCRLSYATAPWTRVAVGGSDGDFGFSDGFSDGSDQLIGVHAQE